MTSHFKTLWMPLFVAVMMTAGAQAQPGPGMGGMGPGMGGGGPGAGWRAGQGNTPGFALMSQQERIDHQNRMRSMRSYDECVAYVGEHHALMATRAQEKGIALQPPRNPCDMMKSRGRIQ